VLIYAGALLIPFESLRTRPATEHLMLRQRFAQDSSCETTIIGWVQQEGWPSTVRLFYPPSMVWVLCLTRCSCIEPLITGRHRDALPHLHILCPKCNRERQHERRARLRTARNARLRYVCASTGARDFRCRVHTRNDCWFNFHK
jgi:hypothetical protein